MKVAFGNLIVNVAPLIEANIRSLDKLKKYLRRCFQELAPQLSTAESFDHVMKLVQNKCTIFNICCLETITDHFNITEAEPHITKFKTTVDTFCECVRADICLKKNFKTTLPSHHLTCETIKFLVVWTADKCTLCHIKGLLSKAFGDMVSSVQVRTIDDRNSITIICYAPLRLMDFLLISAKENLDLLKEMGVIKLIIDYHVILDKRKENEEMRAIDLRHEMKSSNTVIKQMITEVSDLKSQISRNNEDIKLMKEKEIEEIYLGKTVTKDFSSSACQMLQIHFDKLQQWMAPRVLLM